MITISDTAVKEIKRLQSSQQKKNSHLYLQVKEGGCEGLFYNLELQDTISEGDRHYEIKGISLTMTEKTLSYIEGLKIDYAEDLMGGGFRFKNPQAEKNCNCGQSFSLKKT